MKKPFKIEVELEELETIMTALNLELIRLREGAGTESSTVTPEEWLKMLTAAHSAVADFTTNERR